VRRDIGMGARDRGDAPRPEAPQDLARAHGREHVPQALLSDWEPPADDDDDRPILAAGGREARRPTATGERAARATATSPSSIEDAETASGMPDEPAVTGRPRDAAPSGQRSPSDLRGDDDRHPQLPSLPGITEEGAPGAPAPARREGRGPRDGRPTRERERPRAGDRPREDRPPNDRPREDRPAREDRPREDQPDARHDASLSNIFLNVGRRDGVSPEELQRLLAETGGIPESETGNIRVRDRITFVTVKKELADRAIKALAGQVMGGRTVVAEPARDKV
jgi:hypothetical protein